MAANQSIAAAKTENVLKSGEVLRAGRCTVTVLPQFGGKIASIRVGEHELLQAPLAPVAPRTPTMSFDEADASGWDECIPSVAGCQVETEYGRARIPDHGDLWRVEWQETEHGKQHQEVTGSLSSLSHVGKCFSMPLELERGMELTETHEGWQLKLNYVLVNRGSFSLPWSWAAHPLFVVQQGDHIVLPESIRVLRVEGSAGGRLGTNGRTVGWPVATLADGSRSDISVAKAPDAGTGDKLFAGPLRSSESWCALERPSAGIRIAVKFDPAATPYLGLWICYGGWPEKPGPKQVCVALEPATAPVDSLANTGFWSRTIAPGESCSWPMELEITQLRDNPDA